MQDDRFKYSDLVLGDPKIRSYAGAPLLYERNGKTYKLGTLCVIDATPREVTSEQISLLETMAKLVVAEIEIREKNSKGTKDASVKVHLFPRRKAGDSIFPEKGRLPVKVDRETVESMFGVAQPDAARALGISLTSLKQVCRKLGIQRWPYQRLVCPSTPGMGGLVVGGAACSSSSQQRVAGGSPSHHTSAPLSIAPAVRGVQRMTGQLAINSSTLEIIWLGTELERVFEASPFPVVGQRLVHLLHPRGTRRLWTFLRNLATSTESSEEAAAEAQEGVTCQMLMYMKCGMDVTSEEFDCRVQPRVVASDIAQNRMMLQLQLTSKTMPPMMPMSMNGLQMQDLLRKSGQFVVDDLASETDYSSVSTRSCNTSGLTDLWNQWERQILALAAQAPAPLESVGQESSPVDRQHPALECLNLLKQLDKRSSMRVIQNCTRMLVVPELHGNVIAVASHVRFAAAHDDVAVNPLGPIADWHPSEGLLLGLAGAPVMCNGTLQFRNSVGHFVPTAYWDAANSSLHVQIKRLRTENGRFAIYQTEHIVVSEHDGRTVIVLVGTILGGNGGQEVDVQGSDPFNYRIVLGQVGTFVAGASSGSR